MRLLNPGLTIHVDGDRAGELCHASWHQIVAWQGHLHFGIRCSSMDNPRAPASLWGIAIISRAQSHKIYPPYVTFG